MSIKQAATNRIQGYPVDNSKRPPVSETVDLFKNVRHTRVTVSALAADTAISQIAGAADYAADGDLVQAGTDLFEVDSTLTTGDIQTSAVTPIKLKAIPALGSMQLSQFGAALDGATDDSAALDRAISVAAARGAKRLIIGGTASVGDITLTGLDLDLTIVGGTLKFNGSDHVLKLDTCTGRVDFEDVIIDGDGLASTDHLIRATSDANLDLRFKRGAFVNLGTQATNTISGGALRVGNAKGGIFDAALGSLYCRSKQIFGLGYGEFGAVGVYTQDGAKLDGNLFRLGLIGAGLRAAGKSYVKACHCEDIYDTGLSAGQYGNFVSAYLIDGFSVEGNFFKTAFASGVRWYDSRGVVNGNRIYDTALAGIYAEFGAEGSTISGNVTNGCGTDGIAVANPEDITTDVKVTTVTGNVCIRNGYLQTYSRDALPPSFPGGYPAYLIASEHDAWANSTAYSVGDLAVDSGNVYRCDTAHTSAASGTFTDDYNSDPTRWTWVLQGRNRCSGITATFGTVTGNTVNGTNACDLGEGVAIRGGAQAYNGPLMIGQNFARNVDYLVGFGESNARLAPMYISGVRGEYRKAPIAQLGGGYVVNPGFSGSGRDCIITDMICPIADRPPNLEPGSWLIDPDSGIRYSFIGSDATAADGSWSNDIASATTGLTLGPRHIGRSIRCSASLTITLPQASDEDIPIGAMFHVWRLTTGTVTIAAGTGATVTGTTSLTTNYQKVTIVKTFANAYEVLAG